MQGRSRVQRELLDVESVAGHLLEPGSVFVFLAGHRQRLFPAEMFEDLFPSGRGRPSLPPDVVAAVIVLQTLHGLSDREAAEAVTFDLRWKAACGVAVDAGAFHPSTLTYWRRRLAGSERPNRIFEAVRQYVNVLGWESAQRQQRAHTSLHRRWNVTASAASRSDRPCNVCNTITAATTSQAATTGGHSPRETDPRTSPPETDPLEVPSQHEHAAGSADDQRRTPRAAARAEPANNLREPNAPKPEPTSHAGAALLGLPGPRLSAVNTLITVAPTGAESSKADVPQLPTTLDGAGRDGRSAAKPPGVDDPPAHPRRRHAPTLDAGRLRAAVEAIREATDLVVQLSTGGSVHDPLDQRLTVLDAEPDSCSLTCGTTNFGDDVFLNPWPFMVELYRQSIEREVVPEFELFDLGHVAALRRLLDQEGLPFGGAVHVDFVTGVPGGMPGTPAALLAGVALLPPQVTSWSATGIGRSHLPIAAAALVGRRSSAGRDGGQPRVRPRPGGGAQRRAGSPRRRAGEADAATADDHRRGARHARRQTPLTPPTHEAPQSPHRPRGQLRPLCDPAYRPKLASRRAGRRVSGLTLSPVCILLTRASTMDA